MSLREAIDRGLANAEAEAGYIRRVFVEHVEAEVTPAVLASALQQRLVECATRREVIEAYRSHVQHLIDAAVSGMEAQRAEIERLRAELDKTSEGQRG